jgi:hypothetical protein
LESTALHLEARGDYRELIGFVECWNEVGEPTVMARVAQARALVAFCRMDRAWIRLKDIAESEDASVDALTLAATLFIARGWPGRAHSPLERALGMAGDDAAVQALWDKLSEPPVQPDDRIRVLEEEHNLEALLPLAEVYMATGATLKAQAVLEGLKRHHPGNERVGNLLWALAGDFSLAGTLAEITARLGPDLMQLSELGDEAEHTESLAIADVPPADLPPEEAENAGFPALFRSSVPHAADYEHSEVTQTGHMASRDEMRSVVPDDTTDVGAEAVPVQPTVGDTQILRVIGGSIEPMEGQIHKEITTAKPFDLNEYRRAMNVASDFDLESEDDDVVVVTRRERSEQDTAESFPVLMPDPTSEAEHLPRVLRDAETPKPKPRKPRKAATPPRQTPADRPRVDVDVDWPPRGSRAGPWLVALAVLLTLGGLVIVTGLALLLT